MRRLPFALAVVLFASSSAAQLTAWAGWDASPEAYFLTDAERTEWRSVRTDQEATAYIIQFRARRGGDAFKAEVDRRVGTANRFFTNDGVEGWKTFRGKLVVLLGIPTTVNTSELMGKKTTGASKPPPEAVTDLGAMAFTPTLGRDSLAIRYVRWVTLRFPAKNLYAFGGEDYSVVIEVEASGGREQLRYAKDLKELNRLLKAAVEESIVPPPAGQ